MVGRYLPTIGTYGTYVLLKTHLVLELPEYDLVSSLVLRLLQHGLRVPQQGLRPLQVLLQLGHLQHHVDTVPTGAIRYRSRYGTRYSTGTVPGSMGTGT